MKIKTLVVLLVIVLVLLVYNIFIYSFLNSNIDSQTRYQITTYLKNNINQDGYYKYITASNNKDGTINVYIKIEDEYYHFIMVRDNGYKIILVNQEIPEYIK